MSIERNRGQLANLMEWFERMADAGVNITEATRIFNDLDASEQQKIICRPWFSRSTGKPIKRPLRFTRRQGVQS